MWGEYEAGCTAGLGWQGQGWRLSGMEQLGGWNELPQQIKQWGLANFIIRQTDEKGYLMRR